MAGLPRKGQIILALISFVRPALRTYLSFSVRIFHRFYGPHVVGHPGHVAIRHVEESMVAPGVTPAVLNDELLSCIVVPNADDSVTSKRVL